MFNLDAIIAGLRSTDNRWEAILDLKMSHNEEWESSLIFLLNDPDWVVRWCVSEKLGDLGLKTSIVPLIKCLGDSDSNVRRNAMKALEKFDEAVVLVAIPYLGHDNFHVRGNLCRLMISFGSRIVSILRHEMHGHNTMIKNLILFIIYKINPSQMESIIQEALTIPELQKSAIILVGMRQKVSLISWLIPLYSIPKLRRVILYSIRLIGKKESFLFIVRLLTFPHTAQVAEQIIIKIGTPMLPHLIVSLTKPGFSKSRLMALIYRIGPDRVMDKLYILSKKNYEIDHLVTTLNAR